MYKLMGPFVWDKADGGDGIRRNIGEMIPEGVIKNSTLLNGLLQTRTVIVVDEKTGKKIETEYDYNTLTDADIDYLARQSNYKAVNDAVVYKRYNVETLRKLKAAVLGNPGFENREIVGNTIDIKIKEVESSLHKESENVQKEKNTHSK